MNEYDKQKDKFKLVSVICSQTIQIIWVNMLLTLIVTELPIPVYAQMAIIDLGVIFFVYRAYKKTMEKYNQLDVILFSKKDSDIKKTSNIAKTIKEKEEEIK